MVDNPIVLRQVITTMPTRSADVKELFDQVSIIEDVDERQKWLEQACIDRPELRKQVEDLLKAHDAVGSFLQNPRAADVAFEPPAENVGSVIGPYKLKEQIGEGGMGVVYVAQQTEPVKRKVALKLIKPGMDTKQVIGRFEAERQALALLDHPCISKVLDAGTTASGRPYFVMELVRGVPIDVYCDDHSLPLRDRLELFVAVCRAVQHAHQNGIIHRDIKPSNVLVTRIDGKPVPKVIDFGVAKATNRRLSNVTLYTQFAEMIGTPLFMSPEQAEMTDLDVDTRSDVYSLGVLLYVLLTGRTPASYEVLRKASHVERLRIIREDEPLRPSVRLSTLNEADLSTISDQRGTVSKRLREVVRGELDWIVMRSLEKDRNRRYESPSAFAADIERYLSNEPIQACPASTWYRFRKFASRNTMAIMTVFIVALSLIFGTGISIWQALEAIHARRLADERFVEMNEQRTIAVREQGEALKAKREAERTSAFSGQLVYAADIRLAAVARQQGDVRRSIELLDRHIPQSGSTDLRGYEWWYLRQFAAAESREIVSGTNGSIVARFSRNGTYLVSGRHDGTIHVWDGRTEKFLFELRGHRDLVRSLDFTPDGNTLASIGDDGFIRLWDLTQRKMKLSIHAYQGIGEQVFFGMGGKVLVSHGETSLIAIRDSKTGKILRTFTGHAKVVDCMDVSLDGRFCVSGDTLGAFVWNLETLSPMRNLEGNPNLWCLRFSPDGTLVAGATNDRQVGLWDVKTGKRLMHSPGHEAKVQDLAFHPSGRLFASSDKAGVVRTWPLDSVSASLDREFSQSAWWCEFLRDGRLCVQMSDQVLLLRPEIRTRQQKVLSNASKLLLPPTGILSFSKDGSRLLCRTELYSIKGDDSERWRRVLALPTNFEKPVATALSPDGTLIAIGGHEGILRLWKVRDGSRELVKTLPSENQFVTLRFSGDGKWLASGHHNGDVIIWDVRMQKMHRKLIGHTLAIEQCDFSPDGKTLASASLDKTARTWDVATGRVMAVLRHGERVGTLAFSPDGSLLASHSYIPENLLRFWDARTGKLLNAFSPCKRDPHRISFSPDGRYLALCGWPSSKLTILRVQDSLLKNQWPRSIFAHNARAWTVGFSPDGKRLVTASKDGTVKAWPTRNRRPTQTKVHGSQHHINVAFNADAADLVLIGGWHMEVWDHKTRSAQRLGGKFEAEANWLARSPADGRIATAHADGVVRLWSSSGEFETKIDAHEKGVDRVVFSSDGGMLATASVDGFGKLWDAVSGELIAAFKMGHTCQNVVFSPSGKLLACCGLDDIALFDTQTCKRIHHLKGHQNTATCAVFSPDGRQVATGSHDRTIRIWDVKTGSVLHVIAAHRHKVHSIAFSPDGRTIVSGDVAGTVAFSHVATGQFLFGEKLGKTRIRQLVFSPGGTTVAVVNGDGVVLLDAPLIQAQQSATSR